MKFQSTCLLLVLLIFAPMSFTQNSSYGAELNTPQKKEEKEDKKRPRGLTHEVWSAEGYASADSVTANIGGSMLKYGTIVGIIAAAIALLVSTSEEGGGGNGGNGHQHQHQHAHMHS